MMITLREAASRLDCLPETLRQDVRQNPTWSASI
jgi:hypothetical protein